MLFWTAPCPAPWAPYVAPVIVTQSGEYEGKEGVVGAEPFFHATARSGPNSDSMLCS